MRFGVLQEGMIALWRGWLPSVIGVIPYVGLNFSVYETLKDMTLKAYGESFLLHIIHQQSYCALSAHDMANASSYHTCAPPVSRSKACAVDLHI